MRSFDIWPYSYAVVRSRCWLTTVVMRGECDMREIRQQGPYHYVFSRYVDPIATVQPGETVAIYTDDAFESQISNPSDKPSQILGAYLNPQTGPIYVEGAEPGDTLAVKIENIEPTRDWAVSVFVPFFGEIGRASCRERV